MDYVVVFVLGMLAATLLIRWAARKVIDRWMEQIADENPEPADNELRVNVEFDQNIYFLYNSDNGSFIAQGKNLLELKDNLVQRFANRHIKIVKGDPAAMEALAKQLKELDENSNSVGSAS